MAYSIYNKRISIGRHGVTLMEVLISIAIVAIGLLGVVALIPVGGQLAQTGARNDRKANVGRRSFREFKIRGMHSVINNWMVWTTQFDVPIATMAGFDNLVEDPVSICIDPLAFRLAGTPEDAAVFGDDSALATSFMNRVVTSNVAAEGATVLGPACEEVFIAQDDLVFEEPDDNAAPPLQTMLTTVDGAGNSVLGKRYAGGRYSWLATLVPVDPINKTSGDLYRLSTAVVAERNAFQPDEVLRVTDIAFPEVKLEAASPYLRVGRWIMLGAKLPGDPIGEGNYGWYRIKGVTDSGTGTEQILTLSGLPLKVPTGASIYAIVVPNVVNVYTKTIRIKP